MEYIVQISACDWGQPIMCTDGIITVLITEANLYKPHFEKPYYRMHIAEDTAIGTKFLALLAEDNDYGSNGQVGYQIINLQSHFKIDENIGVLQVMKKLDREEMAFHRLTVMAFDHGHPMKVAFVNVTIILTDINDNAPLCAESIRKVIIPEDYPNNVLLTCIAAWDPDEGKNGEVSYAFDSTIEASVTLPFRIQEDTGCIFVNTDEPFDFETAKLYNLSVEAMDSGEPMLSSICTVLVELSDVNENLSPPLFDDIAYETVVHENMPVWTEVLALNAVDPDNPELPLKYTVVGGDGISSFTVDSEGILRTSVILDREACDSYWLTIEASDLNPVPLTSALHVFVRILDKNDHVPLSLHPIYFSSVPENSPEDTVIIKVEAEDKDDFPKRYGITNVRFKIISGDPQSFFAIDSKTGYVVTRGRRRLDRETQKEHVILVEFCDEGDPKLCATVPVIITITDLNDNPPIFKQTTYKFNVPADEIGELCRIFAIDIDEGQNAQLLYNFTEADARFSIDSDGRIVTSEPLKENENYQLIVKASDMGQPQKTSSSISITLNAIGRHTKIVGNGKPKLLNKIRWTRISISDANSIGETIGLIEAEDPDGDQLWWKIIDGNPNNTFAISCDAGELYLTKSLDFIKRDITEVRLKFSVNDGHDTTEGMVFIEVSRQYQSRPEFDVQHHKIHVSMTAPVGTIVHTLKATVEQLNGSISDRGIIFGIHVVEDIAVTDKLRVNPSSGEIVIAEPLNNIVTNFFTLVVYARFNQMINYALVNISLYDESKMSPKFVVPEYVTFISAGSPVGTKVLTVRACVLYHSNIKYSIIEGNENGHFTISEYSGEIKIASSLTLYGNERTILTVQASIQQNDSLSDRCNVEINILNDDLGRVNFLNNVTSIRYSFRDPCPLLQYIQFPELSPQNWLLVLRQILILIISENQYAPYFNNMIYHGYIQENMPPNSSVLLKNGCQLIVRAIDHDKGINGLVNYRAVSPLEPYFTVDYISGAVLTKATLDFEKIKHWSFYIQASDSAPLMLTSAVPALVEIAVIDMNDMAPSFIQKHYNTTLFLPTLKGTTVCYVSAEDIDAVGVLRYAIIASADSKLFAVEEFTGRIYTDGNSSADYAKNSYEINLIVSDGLKSDSAILSVHIQNTSQTGSIIKFLKTNYEGMITENITSSVAVQLLTVNARSVTNDYLLYSILNPNSYFTVGATSGIVSWTGRVIDREEVSTIQFIVQAKRLNGGNERAQSIVTIKIKDKNDCEPRFIDLPYELTVSRDGKPGDKVIIVKAIDADEGLSGIVRYKLKTGIEFFEINKYDGKIVISQAFESANFDSISLEIIAEDQGEPSLSSSALVIIHIVDRNIPIFGNRYQEAHIPENASPGSLVTNIHAVSIAGGRIGYAIKSGNDDNRFKIDFNTGMISVHKALDREKCAIYNLTVVAIDITRLGVRAESYAIIKIDDISDTAPYFIQLLYNVSVSETTPIGTELLKIEAVDPDIGDNYISYGIIGPDASILSVDPRSGIISLMKPLDFETKRLFKFKLTASDSMQLTSEADLLLHVMDANDISPRFISQTFHSTIESETPTNQFVAKLDASDEDTISNLENGTRFLFSIIDGDETLLQINHSTGVVSLLRAIAEDDLKTGKNTLTYKSGQQSPRFERMHYFINIIENRNPFNYEERRIHQFIIMVIDASDRRAFATLTINVVDENDNTPQFISSNIETLVPADSHPGESVLMVFAFDYDVGDELEYSIVDSDEFRSKYFAIHPKQGLIIVQEPLNDLVDEQISLFIRVTDSANPPHQNETSVVLNISPVLHLPKFSTQHFLFSVLENAPIGTVVGHLQQDSQLELPDVIFSLLEMDRLSDFLFSVKQENGQIIVNKMLDYEKTREIRFLVSLHSKRQFGAKAVSLVTIRIMDVNDNKPHFENADERIVISEDLLVGSSITVVRAVDEDAMGLNLKLQYILEEGNSNGTFKLDQKRGGQSTRKKITIVVRDVNDSPPQFSQKIYFIQHYVENLRIGQNILQLQVHDPDLYPNNITELHFITGNEHGIFSLEKDILVLSKLPSDFYSLESHLLILAYDGKYAAKTEVTVKLLSNFSQLQCEPEEILRNITEDSLPGTAVRMGYQKFGESVQFSLIGSESYLFSIERNGTIVVREELISHVSNEIELFLRTETANSLCIQRLIIKIERTNEGRIAFTQPIFMFSTLEFEEMFSRLEATVGDLDGIGRVTFKFVNNNQYMELFDIDNETGVVTAISPLDREVIDQYNFSVLASTNAEHSAEAKVIIDVEDVNDNSPIFEQNTYHLRIAENEAIGKELFQLKAYGGDDKELVSKILNHISADERFLGTDFPGMLKLASTLDFEKLEKFAVTIIAIDSGKPPRSSTCEVHIEILDVLANDLDSEHFGRVSYLITNDVATFTIGEDGWITTTEMLDREVESTYRLIVKAIDGGTPPLFDSTVVEIDVKDENDNAPLLSIEGVEPGHVILPISIIDNDKEPNTGPYKLEIIGSGASLFAFDNTLNLITTKKLPPHSKKEVYLLSIKVSDKDNLSTECPMTLFIKEESRHAPQSHALKITLNTLMGEFLGGIVGKVMATDEDLTDMLRYSLADPETSASSIWSDHQRSKLPFSVDSETGDIIGEADLLAGTYRFNISITDGKYITAVPVVIDVSSIDQDALDHSVSLRIYNLLGEAFLTSTLRISYILCPETALDQDLDILFTVSRADSRGYHRPNFIRQRLEDNVAELSENIGAEIISVMTEVCRRDLCINGECRDRLYLDDAHNVCYKTDYQSFSAPMYLRTYDCTCRTGYAGKRCDIPIDKCSRDQCTKEEICVPMSTEIGFDCICPPGTTGDRCTTTVCGRDKHECTQGAEIAVVGDSFFHITVANSVERRLELTINFKTTSTDAVIMHAAGNSDFHTIEIEKRYVQYRWNCGTGPGVVRINQQKVSDGKWHSLKVSRRSRHAKLVLDGIYEKEGDSPQGSDVVNLYRESLRLTFGAMVAQLVNDTVFTTASDLKPVVTRGMVGCFGRISVDGYEIPRTKQGLYLYNTRLNCDAIVSAPCATSPCENEGTCISSDEKTYNCACSPRYSGKSCEIDLTPCVSRPCPRGVECINLHNDFYCSCPHGFTGKTCQLRGDWDPCSSNPCGYFGSCIRLPHSVGFICNCSHGYSGTACRDRSPDLITDGRRLNAIKIIGLIIVILLLLIVAALIGRKPSKGREMEYETNNFNPRVSMSYDGVSHTVTPAPPLFPRLHNSNYEKGLPTVQVHPFPIHERISSSSIGGSRSPSLVGSNKCRIRWVTEASSMKNCNLNRTTSCDETVPLAGTEPLRRYGEMIVGDDDEVASYSSSQLQLPTRIDRYRHSSGYKARMKRIRNTHASDESAAKEDWRIQCEERINEACDAAAELRSERLKNNPNISKNVTNDSSPNMQEDDDYMTMRPMHRRMISSSSGSQRRPLLETSDSDGIESSDFSYPDELKSSQHRKPPLPPAHNIKRKNNKAVDDTVASNRVYDEPAGDAGNTDKKSYVVVKKAQSTSELMHSSKRFEDFSNIDDSDDDRTVHTSTSPNVHQTMARPQHEFYDDIRFFLYSDHLFMHGAAQSHLNYIICCDKIPLYERAVTSVMKGFEAHKRYTAHGAKQFRKKYTILEELGRGGFGIVYKAKRNEDNAPVAVKFVEHKRVREWTMKCKQLIPTEICLLEMCRSVPGVVQLIDWFANSKGFLIVMERPEQCLDLFDLISVYGYLDEDIARSIFVQILNTTCLLYNTYGIFHRDIKDENVIIDMHTGEAMLVDFGAAALISEACIKEFQGTRSYCPPEWFKRLTYMPSEATVWSLGIVLYVMVSGCLPFQNEIQICLGRFTIPKHISKDCENLLRQCLAVTPSRRPDLLEIFKHQWLNQPIVVYSEPFRIVLQQNFQRRKEAQASNRLKQNRIQEKDKRIQMPREVSLSSHINSTINSELLKNTVIIQGSQITWNYDNVVMNIRTDMFALREYYEVNGNLVRPNFIMEESEHSDSLFYSACESFSMISSDPQFSESYITTLEDNRECSSQGSKEATGNQASDEDSSTETFSFYNGTEVLNSKLVTQHWIQDVGIASKYESPELQRPLTCQGQKQANVDSKFLRIFNTEPQRLATSNITTIVSK
ncbi:BMA-PRK-1 [Dirofilaria immitis]|nr:BMA-PRK-1 [Dirofilaria immitis]